MSRMTRRAQAGSAHPRRAVILVQSAGPVLAGQGGRRTFAAAGRKLIPAVCLCLGEVRVPPPERIAPPTDVTSPPRFERRRQFGEETFLSFPSQCYKRPEK